MACSDGDDGPACEDLGDFRLPTPVLPPDETDAPADAPPAPTAEGIAVETTVSQASVAQPTSLCSFAEPAELPVLYCAASDEPNACERPITALASEPEATQRVDRSVLE
jgi:hypothetical protein